MIDEITSVYLCTRREKFSVAVRRIGDDGADAQTHAGYCQLYIAMAWHGIAVARNS